MAKGIQNMAGDTKCGSRLAIFCIPTHFVAAPLPYLVSPHTLWGIHYLALHRFIHFSMHADDNTVQVNTNISFIF